MADNPTALMQQLHDEHAAALWGFCLHLTSDPVRAEDVAQETLLRAWQHPDSLDPSRGPLRPWLFTVAHRVVIDQHRARLARPPETSDRALEHLPVEDSIDEALEPWLVADALGALTPQHRDALVQTYYAGRTVNEAATVLGVPPGTVKSRVFYALRALKLALEERGVT